MNSSHAYLDLVAMYDDEAGEQIAYFRSNRWDNSSQIPYIIIYNSTTPTTTTTIPNIIIINGSELSDCYVHKEYANTNYGYYPILFFSSNNNSGKLPSRIYLKINLSSISNISITNATLYFNTDVYGLPNRIYLHEVYNNSRFSETILTWNNQPCGTDIGEIGVLDPAECNQSYIIQFNITDTSYTWYNIPMKEIIDKTLNKSDKTLVLLFKTHENEICTNCYGYLKGRYTGYSEKWYLELNYTITTTTTTSSTTTTSIGTTSTVRQPVIANISDYYGNITTGLIPEGSSFLGSRVDLGKYLLGIFLVVAFTAGAIYVADMQTGLFVGMVVMFILSLVTMLPIVVAYVMIIIAVLIIGKEIRNHI
jgi:hypothetical protein